MTALKVLAAIVLVLFLLGLVRLGGEVEYSHSGLGVKLRLGAFRFSLYPRKEKGEKPEKREKPPKQKEQKEPEEPAEKRGGSLELFRELLPLVGKAAGALKRKIRIDRLYLTYTVGGPDAAKTAVNYGYSNLAASMFWPIFEQNFNVKNYRIRTGVDFTARGPSVYLLSAFSARLGQLFSFALRFGFQFLMAYRRAKSGK